MHKDLTEGWALQLGRGVKTPSEILDRGLLDDQVGPGPKQTHDIAILFEGLQFMTGPIDINLNPKP